MITENCVSFNIAKLLKEKGYKEWSSHYYRTDVRYKGNSISFDEECELKSEGLGNEIEYIEGGILVHFGYSNSDKFTSACAAPTIYEVMDFLRENHQIHISVNPFKHYDELYYQFDLYINGVLQKENSHYLYNTYKDAAEAAIKYVLENLITKI